MWFKYGLKAQKLLAQGIALGIIAVSKAPVRAKALLIARYLKLLPLQGDKFVLRITQGAARARSFCPFRACEPTCEILVIPHLP